MDGPTVGMAINGFGHPIIPKRARFKGMDRKRAFAGHGTRRRKREPHTGSVLIVEWARCSVRDDSCVSVVLSVVKIQTRSTDAQITLNTLEPGRRGPGWCSWCATKRIKRPKQQVKQTIVVVGCQWVERRNRFWKPMRRLCEKKRRPKPWQPWHSVAFVLVAGVFFVCFFLVAVASVFGINAAHALSVSYCVSC